MTDDDRQGQDRVGEREDFSRAEFARFVQEAKDMRAERDAARAWSARWKAAAKHHRVGEVNLLVALCEMQAALNAQAARADRAETRLAGMADALTWVSANLSAQIRGSLLVDCPTPTEALRAARASLDDYRAWHGQPAEQGAGDEG